MARTADMGLFRKMGEYLGPNDSSGDQSAALSLEKNRGLSGQDIVTLSTQDWNCLWTRKQRFMLQFARQGNKVLYVETQFHWLTYFKRFRSQWRRIYLFLLGPRQVETNLFIYTPPLLLPAFQIFPILNVINNYILGKFLKANMRKLGIEKPLLWLYSHYNGPLVKILNCRRALYECVDEFSGAKGLVKPEVAKSQEKITLRAVDAAIVTAPALKLSKANFNRNIHVIPNASNVAHFNRVMTDNLDEPKELKSIQRPRLIFIGAVAYWIDLELLRDIAQKKPHWQIIMVGPIQVNIKNMEKAKNIHFLGKRPYSLIPNYLAWSDIALNPYIVDSVAENCSPLKLYEYMAAGLPIVSTDMPEARQFHKLVNIAGTHDEFIENIERIICWDLEKRAEHSQAASVEAQKHTWEKRFLDVEKVVQEALR
jgi:glycosyltransferase involved in cell wall biosynthesis